MAAITYFIIMILLKLTLVPNLINCDSGEELPKTWDRDRLRLQLFTNYDKNRHPMMNEENQTHVNVGLLLDYVDIDELQGQMVLNGWLKLDWWDIDRSWNPSEFENQKTLSVRSSEVWTPDINFHQSPTAQRDQEVLGEAPVIIQHDGSLRWVPPIACKAFCQLNLRLWPYDEQNCRLHIGLWDLSRLEATSSFNDGAHGPKGSFKFFKWEITSIQWTQQNDFGRQYDYIEYKFWLIRRSSVYQKVVVTPIVALIIISLCIFWIPSYMGEKLLLNGIAVVINVSLLMYFTQLLPIVAENTPLIVHFCSCSLLLLSLSTVETVIVLYVSTARHKVQLPEVVKRRLKGCLGRTLLVTQFTYKEQMSGDERQAEDRSRGLAHLIKDDGTLSNSSNSYMVDNNAPANGEHNTLTPASNFATQDQLSQQLDWTLLAVVIDRLSFLIFCLIYLLLIAIYAC